MAEVASRTSPDSGGRFDHLLALRVAKSAARRNLRFVPLLLVAVRRVRAALGGGSSLDAPDPGVAQDAHWVDRDGAWWARVNGVPDLAWGGAKAQANACWRGSLAAEAEDMPVRYGTLRAVGARVTAAFDWIADRFCQFALSEEGHAAPPTRSLGGLGRPGGVMGAVQIWRNDRLTRLDHHPRGFS